MAGWSFAAIFTAEDGRPYSARVGSDIVTIQTESIKSVLDRSKFERLRQDIVEQGPRISKALLDFQAALIGAM